jgi:TfoX/Sxy family transcriptional regulator of competence genes
MAYSEQLAGRIREHLSHIQSLEEKKMFGGLAFMVNGKMCLGVMKDEMMVRLDPDLFEQALSKRGAKIMDFSGKPMKAFLFVEQEGMDTNKDLKYWIDLALEYNPRAKASKKKTPKK